MEKKMNREEVIELVESLGIDFSEFWILSTGGLVIRDLYPDAGDLDIAVTKKGLEQLKEKYNIIRKPNGFYIVNDRVECVLDTKEPYKIEEFGKYNLESFEKYFEFLRSTMRDKDKEKYKIVKSILENPKPYYEKKEKMLKKLK